jgi:disulfide bond formation protein DsbB
MIARMGRRPGNFIGFATCVALVAYALYVQYGLHLEPCPLCIFQRIAVIALGTVFLIAALHNPARIGARIYAGLIVLAAAAGGGVAARHLWIQSLPPDKVPACGAPFAQLWDMLPLRGLIATVLRGDGECAKIDWTFLGLAMPAWVLIALVALATWGLIVNLKPTEARSK